MSFNENNRTKCTDDCLYKTGVRVCVCLNKETLKRDKKLDNSGYICVGGGGHWGWEVGRKDTKQGKTFHCKPF